MSTHKNLKIPVVQLNIHRSKTAAASLSRDLSKVQISLLQEPNTFNDQVVGFGKFEVYKGWKRDEGPRACIVTSPNIKAWQLPEFSDADCVSIKTTWDKVGTVAFASVYMAHGTGIPTPKLETLTEYCYRNKIPLIVGSDANAHHTGTEVP